MALAIQLGILAICSVPLRCDEAPTGTKWALLIGVNEYEDKNIGWLQYAENDASAVAQSLIEAGFPREQVCLMTTAQKGTAHYPTAKNVGTQLSRLAAKVNPNDSVLLYFSGHGFQNQNGHALGTADTRPTAKDLFQTTVSMKSLQDKLKQIHARQTFVIIDACRNDPMLSKALTDRSGTRKWSKDLQQVSRSLAESKPGTASLFACSEGERSYEDSKQQHGVFTYYLLQALRGKVMGASGEVTVADTYDYVKDNVLKWSQEHLGGNSQTPDLITVSESPLVLTVAKAESPLPVLKEPLVPHNENPGFKAKLWLNREDERYEKGEELLISFTVERDCYVTILNRDSQGETWRLFPAENIGNNNFCKAGKVYTIPSAEALGQYFIEPPLGMESIHLIATLNAGPLIEPGDAVALLDSPYLAVRPTGLKKVGIRLKQMQPEIWAEATVTFETVMKRDAVVPEAARGEN